jgi:hypothetical protein
MTATTRRSIAVGAFEDSRQARECVAELRRAGFGEDQIGVAGKSSTTEDDVRTIEVSEDSVATGAATGAVAGAGIGAMWALGIAAGFLPAIGPVVAGGILGSVLASAAGAAAAGGLMGALIGLGLPEEEARYYEEEFRTGRIIVTVKADDRFDEAQAILRRAGAYDMRERSTNPPPVLVM